MDAPMPTARWWLARPGQQPQGPHAEAELIAKVRESGGPADWQVCAEGASEWRPLRSEPAFAAAFAGPAAPPAMPASPPMVGEHRGLLVCLHLGVLASYAIPVAGIALPLGLWLANRDKPSVDLHGKEVMNWIIFTLIASIACIPLFFCGIGIVLAVLLGIAMVVCAILGAVQASNGELFRYPMPFRLIH